MGGGGGSSTSVSGLPDWAKPYVQEAAGDAISFYRPTTDEEGNVTELGAFSHVEGLTPEQQEAFDRKKQLGSQGGVFDQIANDSYSAGQAYRDAASGSGLFGADALGQQVNALQDTIGRAQKTQLGNLNTSASLGGGLGSARQEAATNQALLQTAGNIAQNELASRRGHALEGASGVIGSGSAIQDQFTTGVNAYESVGSAIQQQKQNEGDAAYQGVQRLFGLLGSPAIGQQQVTTQRGGK